MAFILEYNQKQNELKNALPKAETFDEAKKLFLSIHKSMHASHSMKLKSKTILDKLYENLENDDYRAMPSKKNVTIAWNIWHITRIEDITSNILIAKSRQVLNKTWLKKIKTDITDTAIQMNKDEILEFSKYLNIEKLKEYRDAVCIRTQKILENLTFIDTKRKVSQEDIKRILEENGVSEHKDSIWLLDFWGKKTIAGIITMPLTRHESMHINDCIRLKEIILKNKKL